MRIIPFLLGVDGNPKDSLQPCDLDHHKVERGTHVKEDIKNYKHIIAFVSSTIICMIQSMSTASGFVYKM